MYGGINASGAATTISKTTLELEPRGTTRFDPVKLLDLGAQKSIRFKGGRSFKVMVDAFNIFNINTITSYSSGNRSLGTFTQPTVIVAPRVFRFGGRVAFRANCHQRRGSGPRARVPFAIFSRHATYSNFLDLAPPLFS